MNQHLVVRWTLSIFLTALPVALPVADWLVGPRIVTGSEPEFKSELIFPLDPQHNHAPGIVELPNGDLFATWYRGAGERKADDVAVLAAWKRKGAESWSEPFVLADTPGFPDCNTALFVDRDKRLWLFYPTILANTWESCLTNFKVTKQWVAPESGAPHLDSAESLKWDAEGMILLKPDDFAEEARVVLDEELKPYKEKMTEQMAAGIAVLRERLSDKLFQRLGWQPRCKPTQLPSGRILLPLYTDTYSISLMAITDDGGKTWHASKPLLGFGNIQPTVLRRNNGTLVAYMRENGPREKIRVCESKDDGETWGPVGVCELPNPGAGVDGIRLHNGKWLLVYNDTIEGRNRLAVSLSSDEGRTWTKHRHLEDQPTGSYHYPAVTQGADGTIHVAYSYFVEGGKSMKHAAFKDAWVEAGDSVPPRK